MDVRLQIWLLIGCIITLCSIISMIRKEKLDLKYSLSWIIINIVILVLGMFPQMIDWIARLIGVATPINAVFFFGIVFQMLITFSLTVAQYRNSKKLKDLAQKVALLEKQITSKHVVAVRKDNFNIQEKK